MNILCVDDERLAVNLLIDLCHEINPTYNVYGFTNANEALDFAIDHELHIALLDIDMPHISGLELSDKLRACHPQINIIITTAYSQYALDAFSKDCSGYLLKPISLQALLHQFEILRFPIHENTDSTCRVKVTCFGEFKVYIDGITPAFKYNKTTELLAFLIDNKGTSCSNKSILNTLWDDIQNHSEYLKSLKKDLLSTFRDAGIDDVIFQKRGYIGIHRDMISCDYYNFLNSPIDKKVLDFGYMTQYSWAYVTLLTLKKMSHERKVELLHDIHHI
ncbi:LytR/AlgR family response regulator transcription factor [Cellulosilyticum ruminicola]|uniref:LytR/AlgR family response regulator transcription factor n=1 Tax=Cellulosilyticum ruminicola TaxID=425254 RepID=UPI0006D13A6B|nr:response regulator [Cellulosilyticum ruminicola]